MRGTPQLTFDNPLPALQAARENQGPSGRVEERWTDVHRKHGGGTGIRTQERVSPLTVFKTAAFNRSAIPPLSFP